MDFLSNSETAPTSIEPRKTYKKNGKIVYQEDWKGDVVVNASAFNGVIYFDELETNIYRFKLK